MRDVKEMSERCEEDARDECSAHNRVQCSEFTALSSRYCYCTVAVSVAVAVALCTAVAVSTVQILLLH